MKNSIAILIVLCCTLFTQQAFAQNVTKEEVEFKKGDIEFALGVGLIPTFRSKAAKTKVLPLNFNMNYRVSQNFSLGTYLGYSSTNWQPEPVADEVPEDYLNTEYFVTGLRAEGHFNRERVDFYGGGMFGYTISKIDTNVDIENESVDGIMVEEGGKFTYSGYVGLKYMMTKHFGIYGEIGYGVSLISFGITSKF